MLQAAALKLDTYLPRSPRKNRYYRLVEDHYEQLERIWDQKYQQKYGYWRPYVTDVIYKFLDCGDLHLGFARVKCDDCKYEYILPFSCKRRHSGCMGEQFCKAKRPAFARPVIRSVS